TAGAVTLEGEDLLALPEAAMRAVRGARIGMVFQEPSTSLNPVLRVGDQIVEAIQAHTALRGAAARAKAIEWLGRVGIPEPQRRIDEYPFRLSGGQKQRVMIAMTLACEPDFLIADEPTTALDVTIQAQILELLGSLQRDMGMSILLITHDLGVIAETASRVIVMYAGEVVEEAPVTALFAAPHHPYTEGLMRAMPRVGIRRERLATIPGSVPSPTAWPSGCRFHDRCPYAWERCVTDHPPLYQIGGAAGEHVSRCHLAVEPERRARPHEPMAGKMGVGA
ncbi:MAG: ABC transporter ATP-binding protein, partial [Gemmatimonadaceae bacterium]